MEKNHTSKTIESESSKRAKIKNGAKLISVVLVLAIGISLALWHFCQKGTDCEYVYNEGKLAICATMEPIGLTEDTWSEMYEPLGLSQEMWDQEESVDVLPASLPQKMQVQVFPRFTEIGEFYDMRMEVTMEDSGRRILAESNTFNTVWCEEPIVTTTRDQVTYTLCQENWNTNRLAIAAIVTIDDVDWFFHTWGDLEEEAEMKADFEAFLDSFADDPIAWDTLCELKPKGKDIPFSKHIELERRLG